MTPMPKPPVTSSPLTSASATESAAPSARLLASLSSTIAGTQSPSSTSSPTPSGMPSLTATPTQTPPSSQSRRASFSGMATETPPTSSPTGSSRTIDMCGGGGVVKWRADAQISIVTNTLSTYRNYEWCSLTVAVDVDDAASSSLLVVFDSFATESIYDTFWVSSASGWTSRTLSGDTLPPPLHLPTSSSFTFSFHSDGSVTSTGVVFHLRSSAALSQSPSSTQSLTSTPTKTPTATPSMTGLPTPPDAPFAASPSTSLESLMATPSMSGMPTPTSTPPVSLTLQPDLPPVVSPQGGPTQGESAAPSPTPTATPSPSARPVIASAALDGPQSSGNPVVAALASLLALLALCFGVNILRSRARRGVERIDIAPGAGGHGPQAPPPQGSRCAAAFGGLDAVPPIAPNAGHGGAPSGLNPLALGVGIPQPSAPPPPAHQEPECMVCLTERPNTLLSPCGHMHMCEGCTRHWLANNNTCPTCRAPVVSSQRVYM